MYAGETFFFREKQAHFWIVLSDPALDASRVLLVNVTTFQRGSSHKEDVCRLYPGDHGFIEHESCINYHDSRVYPDAHLTSMLARDRIVLHDALEPHILKRIRDGASLSRRIPFEHLEILLDQGLLD